MFISYIIIELLFVSMFGQSFHRIRPLQRFLASKFSTTATIELAPAQVDVDLYQKTIDFVLKKAEENLRKKDLARNVFCNVELNCANLEAVGFDMDFTLAQYNEDFDLLAFEGAKRKLVEVLHYPKEVLDFKYNPDLIRRGLIIDKKQGNILKIDRHKYVRRAFHGMQELADRKIYNQQAALFSGSNFAYIDTMFLVIDAMLFMYLVDLRDKMPEAVLNRSYEQVYADIRHSVDLCHRDGAIKNIVMQNPENYIIQDPDLVPMLQQLKAGGKKVFLLTNSLWEYTSVVMNYLVKSTHSSQNWQDLFDVIIVGGNKPAFLQQDYLSLFSVDTKSGSIRNIEDREKCYPSNNVEDQSKSALTTSFSSTPKVFQGGCWLDLHRMLQVSYGDQILYVGDHIYADILRSKRTLGWRTCLIIPELEHELRISQQQQALQAEILQWRQRQSQEDEAIDYLRSQIHALKTDMESDKKQEDAVVSDRLAQLEKQLNEALLGANQTKQYIKSINENFNRRFNPFWGQLLKAGHQHSRFAKQALDYACLYTSRASNLRFISPQRAFRPIQDFHPSDVFLYESDAIESQVKVD